MKFGTGYYFFFFYLMVHSLEPTFLLFERYTNTQFLYNLRYKHFLWLPLKQINIFFSNWFVQPAAFQTPNICYNTRFTPKMILNKKKIQVLFSNTVCPGSLVHLYMTSCSSSLLVTLKHFRNIFFSVIKTKTNWKTLFQLSGTL